MMEKWGGTRKGDKNVVANDKGEKPEAKGYVRDTNWKMT